MGISLKINKITFEKKETWKKYLHKSEPGKNVNKKLMFF